MRIEDLSDEEYRRRVRRANIRDVILIVVLLVGWFLCLHFFF